MISFIFEFVNKILTSPTIYSLVIYLIYYTYICLASILLPAKVVKGHPNPKRGPQQEYSISGFKLTLITITIIALFGGVLPCLSFFTLFKISIIADQFWPLWSTVNIFALIFSIFLYLKAKFQLSILGQSVQNYSHGSFGLDFWVGKQMYPKIGKFDIKFVAYRVAMIFWLVINFAFLAKQVQLHGFVTFRMICYQIASGFYILDYFWNEQKMLTTWDIINEQFGYMLVFGDYVFIPFVFSVQCHYLLDYEDLQGSLKVITTLLILTLYFVGYYIFRSANSQKNQFKIDPTRQIWGKKPLSIKGKILISGFWGMGKHMNYTGDLIMALSYCLPCGSQLGGYVYVIYLTILLTHRAYRDDAKCQQKYKELWNQYNQKVKYVFVPFQPIDKILRNFGKLLYKTTNEQKTEKRN